jgi:hypothetical protein
MNTKILYLFYICVAVILLFKNHWELVFSISIKWWAILILGLSVAYFQIREHRKNGTLKKHILFSGVLLLSLLVMIYFQLKAD